MVKVSSSQLYWKNKNYNAYTDPASFKTINPGDIYWKNYNLNNEMYPLTIVYYHNNEFNEYRDISELTYFNPET